MTRDTFIAGNWKMFKTLDEARRLAEDIVTGIASSGSRAARRPRYGLFPNAIALAAVAEAARGLEDRVLVGAQNLYHAEEGAFTGEVSAAMVRSAGGRGVILGHSERRHVFGETDDMIGKKVARSLASDLVPVLCVGETLEEREADETHAVVDRQLRGGLAGVERIEDVDRVILAYEPVWAIGTGKTATPAQGQDVQAFLRDQLRGLYEERGGSPAKADEALIIYGGSVKPDNAAALLAEPDIDGFLIGGASLEADSFLRICAAAA